MSTSLPTGNLTRHQYELRMATVFGMLFIAIGVYLPFLPVWLAGNGFDPTAIAVILSAPMFVRIVTTPIILAAADRSADRANVFLILVVATTLLSLGYFLPPSYLIVLLVSVLIMVPWTAISPLADSVALSGVRRLGCSYTKMRIWGTISYLIGNLGGGFIIGWYGYNSVPALIAGGMLALLAVSFLMPRVGPPRKATPSPAEVLENSWRFPSRFLLAALGVGLIAGSHYFIYSFMSIYWQSIGYSDAAIGLLWSWSTAMEAVMFLVFPRFFGRWSAVTVLALAAVTSIFRWLVYPFVEPLGLGLAGYFVVQSIHPFSTGLFLIGLQKIIGEEVPESRTGAAQGLAFLFNGLASAIVVLVSGPIYERMGIYGTLPMAGIAFVALVLILAAARQPHSTGSAGKMVEPS